MAYTHKFEFDIDEISIEGEMSIDGSNSSFKTTGPEEMTVKQHRKIQDLFESLVTFSKECGSINKIGVTKKV